MDINCLPVEMLVEVLKRTDGETLGKCRRVCSRWKHCIDHNNVLWHHFCHKDFKYSSIIARKKASNDCQWYHIYKNLMLWTNISKYEVKQREFYRFTLLDKFHALDVEYGVLPLRDAKGVVLYDINTLTYIPVAIPERYCSKMSSNDQTTVLHVKSGLYLQRSVKNNLHATEATFKADNYVLTKDVLYFYDNRDIFKCDLLLEELSAQIILHLDFDVKELQHNDDKLYVFTDDGQIITASKDGHIITIKPLNCPPEWIRQIKHISAVDNRNFVCYSRNLFKIESDEHRHLYLDFPAITALFFYGDIVLIGTRLGEILIYRLSCQNNAIKSRQEPVFEKLATLPEGKIAVHLDVCERKTGPIFVVATFKEIYLMEVAFFPHELNATKMFPEYKLLMYKRLLKLRDRIQMNRH